MLTHLRVENFLSLKRIDVELGLVNILTGRNASGKSNFIRLFEIPLSLCEGGFLDKCC